MNAWSGKPVCVGDCVWLGVCEAVDVPVLVLLGVPLRVGETEAVVVGLGVSVEVRVPGCVGVCVRVAERVSDAVCDAVLVSVADWLAVDVREGV